MLQTKEERKTDLNPQETAEWLEALEQVVDEAGPDRAAYLVEKLLDRAAEFGVSAPQNINTPFVNTIQAHEEMPFPGNGEMERRIKSLIRWNASAMVVRANKYDPNIGGHISTYASSADSVRNARNVRNIRDQRDGGDSGSWDRKSGRRKGNRVSSGSSGR